ncbi:ABI gene family member 3 [Chelonia mydas]|uniref:ABI gene family member 3 n=1 Tax=Chelonia mydas TaxID=8469 RepID=M7C060_CHEMY|nr:ABI gene family member 3 [Chelonia mydas]
MSELQKLQQHEIPSARQVLRENYSKLHKVADYCENNYMQATDKRKALEETMAYSAQSLASVAYQISNLASNVLQMLDLHATELHQVEANVCCIAQMVDVHKEKVARREIGTLTVCKRPPHYQKIIYPTYQEPLEAYYRKPLNFSTLDDVGHGIKWLSRSERAQGLEMHLCEFTSQLGKKAPCLHLLWLATLPDAAPCRLAAPPAVVPHQPHVASPAAHSAHCLASPLIRRLTVSHLLLPPASSAVTTAAGNINAKVPITQPMPPSLPPPLDIDTMPPPPPLPPVDMPEPSPIGFEMPLPDVPPPFSMPDADFLELPPPPLPSLTEFEDFAPPPPPPPPLGTEEPAWAPDSYLEKVVTLYPYTQQKENELSFPEGAVIYMTRKHSDGWCEGVTSEAEGFFPGNYVEPFCC